MPQVIAAELEDLERRGDYDALIVTVRQALADDRRNLADPFLKGWLGRRWRHLFIAEGAKDQAALSEASRLGGTVAHLARLPRVSLHDKRPDRQKIAERFLKGEAREEWKLEMPEPTIGPIVNTTLVFAPGLIHAQVPVPAFHTAFPELERKYGWRVLQADAHPVRGCEANMADLLATLDRGIGATADKTLIDPADAVPPRDVIFVGYSKGTPDVLTLLANHPEVASRTRAVFTWAGAVGGSYLAHGIYNAVKDVDLGIVGGKISAAVERVLHMIAPFLKLEGEGLRRLDEFDVKQAIYDLTTTRNDEFLAAHAEAIDALDVPIFNITAATTALEVPSFQVQGYLQLAQFDANNDMQLTQDRARMQVPMATHLGVLHGNHWEISYPKFPWEIRAFSPNLDNDFPREAAMTAIMQLCAETGIID